MATAEPQAASRASAPERPPNCRIFLGNLASEKTSREELERIFSKYGKIVEEIVIRKSFGFIQYDNPQSAQDAIKGENGRLIGGVRLDINLADNREPRGKRKTGDRDKSPSPRRRRSSPSRNKRRRRSPSPRDPERDNKRFMPPTRETFRGPILCEIIYLGPSQRDYAKRIEEAILRDVGTFGVESKLIERRGVSDELEKAQKRGLRYVCVVGRQNESKNTLNLHILRPMGKTESKKCILIKFTSLALNGIHTKDAIQTIRQEEQKIAQMFGPLLQQQLQGTQPSFDALGATAFANLQGLSGGLGFSQPQYNLSTTQQMPGNLSGPFPTMTSVPPAPQTFDPNLLSRLLSNFNQQQAMSHAQLPAISQTYPQNVPGYLPSTQFQQSASFSPQSTQLQSASLASPVVQNSQRSPQFQTPTYPNSQPSGPTPTSIPTFQPQQPNPNLAALLSNPKSTELLQSILTKLNPSANQTQSVPNTSSMVKGGAQPQVGQSSSNIRVPNMGTQQDPSAMAGNLLNQFTRSQQNGPTESSTSTTTAYPQTFVNANLDPVKCPNV